MWATSCHLLHLSKGYWNSFISLIRLYQIWLSLLSASWCQCLTRYDILIFLSFFFFMKINSVLINTNCTVPVWNNWIRTFVGKQARSIVKVLPLHLNSCNYITSMKWCELISLFSSSRDLLNVFSLSSPLERPCMLGLHIRRLPYNPNK